MLTFSLVSEMGNILKWKGDSSSNCLTQITPDHCAASFLGPAVPLEFLKTCLGFE